MPEDVETRGARPFWSGTISFGLVSVPVNLLPANRESRLPLRMLGPEGTPLNRRYYSAESDRELPAEDLARAYPIDKDHYVFVTDEELERLAPEKSRDIDVRQFVPVESIPPIYFQRAYFLVPAKGSTKAYRLLAETMEKSRHAGIATFVMRGKEYLVAILAENGILGAETLRFPDEIRTPQDVGLPKPQRPSKQAVQRFQKMIHAVSEQRLSKEELRDEASARLLQLARKKQSQHKDVVEIDQPERKQAEVIDIMTLLKRSLGEKGESRAKSNGRSSHSGRSSRRNGSRQASRPTAVGRGLVGQSRTELLKRAKSLDIPGRSSMNKQQLIKAIQQAA